MAKQALIDAINESIAPFVHPDDLKPSRLTLSIWSGRIRFPHGLRLNADAINEELAKSAPSASSDSSGGGGVGDRIRRRGRANSVAEGSHPAPNYSHNTTSSVAAECGPASAAAPDGTTPKVSNGGAGGGMWSPFSFGTGRSHSNEVPELQSTTARDRSPSRATRRMSNGTAGASTLTSNLVGGDGADATVPTGGSSGGGGTRGNAGMSCTAPSSYIDEAWAVNVHLDAYRNAETEEDQQKAREEARSSTSTSRSTNPFLAGLGLPSNVRLISGYIRQLQIDIPWSSLATKPVVVKLSGVRLAVMPASLPGQISAGSVATAQAPASSGGGFFRARGMRNLRSKEEQTINAKRRRIMMDREIRRRQHDAFLRCLFEDRANGGNENTDTGLIGRSSPTPSIASLGSRSTATGSVPDVLRSATHTTGPTAFATASGAQRRRSYVLGNGEDDEDDDYGMHSIGSLTGSRSSSQSPFLRSPASESMRKMAKRQKMPKDVFRSRLRRRIMENLSVDVRGIHIQICKPNKSEEAATGAHNESNGFVMGIVLDSMQLYTTDEHGRRAKTQSRGSVVKRSTFLKPKTAGRGVDSSGGRPVGGTFLFKALRVSGLGVYLEEGKRRVEIDEETIFGGATFPSRDNSTAEGELSEAALRDSARRRPSDSGDDMSLASMETDGLNDEVLAGGYGKRYVINPISFEAAYRQRNDELPTVLQSQSGTSMTDVQGLQRQRRQVAEKGPGGDETEHLLFSQLPHVSIVLSEPQLRLVAEVVDSFLPAGGQYHSTGALAMALRPLYPEYRPAYSVTSLTASDWWRYALHSVRRMTRPGSCMWRDFMLAFRKKCKYVSLYKRYVAHCDPKEKAFYDIAPAFGHKCTKYCCRIYDPLTPADIESMRTIENDRSISVEALLRWRADVEAQLWRERKLENKSECRTRLDLGESISRLQSVFQGGLGGLGGNASPSGGNAEIQVDDMDDVGGNQKAATLALTADDLDRLELQLEAYVDALSRTSSSRIAEIELSLGFLVVDLVASDLSPVAKLRVGTLDLSYVLSSNCQSALSLTLSSVLVEDMTTFDPMIHNVLRSVHHTAPMDDNRSCASGQSGVGTVGGSTSQPCPASKFSFKRTAAGDLEISLKMTTFEFVLSPLFSSSLNSFLELRGDTRSDDLLDTPALYACAHEMFGAAMHDIKTHANRTWDEKCRQGKHWDLDIEIDPIILVLPGDAMDPDSRAVILSLGQHQLRTLPQDEQKSMDPFAQIWFDKQVNASEESLGGNIWAPTTKEDESSIVADRWELNVSGVTAAIGPSNDENWRHCVVDELIHAGAHSDGNMIAAEVRPYLVLRPCTLQVDLGSSAALEEGVVKHRRSWASANVLSPTILVRFRSDDIIALGRSARQLQEFCGNLSLCLPSASSANASPVSGLGETVSGRIFLRKEENGPDVDGVLPSSILPNQTQLEQRGWREQSVHTFCVSFGLPRLKVGLKISREGSFIAQLDSMHLGLSSYSDETTRGRFELANAWVFYQVEEAEPTVIFGENLPSTKPPIPNHLEEGEKLLVSAELSIEKPIAGPDTRSHVPLEAMNLFLHVKTHDVGIHLYPKLLRVAIKAYERIKQGLSSALLSTDKHTTSHLSNGPGTSTFISITADANLEDDGSVGNSSSDSSVSTADSLLESRPTRDFLGLFFPALSNAKRDLFRPASMLAVTASFSVSNISISIHPDHCEEPSRFDALFSDNLVSINTGDDGGTTTSVEIGSAAVRSASSYEYRQEYCNMMESGGVGGAKFMELTYNRSPSSTIDNDTGKIKPQTQTYIRISPIHITYLQSHVSALSTFLHISGLRGLLASTVSVRRFHALIDSNELADIKMQELDITIPESSSSTTKFTFRVGSSSLVHTIDPTDNAIKAIDLENISLFCAKSKPIGNPVSISVEITASKLDEQGAEEVGTTKTVQRIQVSSSEVHLDITTRQYRQFVATLGNNIGSTSTMVIGDLTGSSPRPRVSRGNSSSIKNSSFRSFQSASAADAAAAAVTGRETPNLLVKVKVSIIIPAISLALRDENGPLAKVSAERAVALLEYGTEVLADINSSLAFGLYSLDITDERQRHRGRNEQEYVLRQLFGEGGSREALGISSKKNDDGSFRLRANVGAWQVNLFPDLLDDVQDFFRLPADQGSNDTGKDISLIGMLREAISDAEEADASPRSTFELKTSTLKFACFEEPVPQDDAATSPRRCITVQFALESKGSVQASKDFIHLFESQTNVDAIEMYSAEEKALKRAVQILGPTSLSFFASKSMAEESDGSMPALTAKVVVSEPIDMTVSTQDVLLMRNIYLGLHDFSQSAIESLSDSLSFLHASGTGFGKFDAVADIPQSTSDVPREIDVSSSVSQKIDFSVMVPSSTLALVNDNIALLPLPLFKFTIENVFLESQSDVIKEEAPRSLVSTIVPMLAQLRFSIRGEVFDSLACRWKMSSQCDADLSYHRQQEACLGEGEYAKCLDIEINPCEIVSSRGLFEKLALSSPFIWMVEVESAHADTSNGTRVVPDGPYGIRNLTGFHLNFSLHEQDKSHECEAGETKHFIFENTRGFGFGYSRVFGQDFEDGKSITVFEKQDAGATKVDPHLLSLSFEDIDSELGSCRAHKYGDGRIVFSEVVSDEGRMILVIRARVLLHNFTRYDLDVGMMLGGYHQPCCSCSGLSSLDKSSAEIAAASTLAQTVALGIPKSDRAAFDKAAEKAKSRLALQLCLNGNNSDPIIPDGRSFVGTMVLPSVPALNEMTTKGSVSETKTMSFSENGAEVQTNNESNGFCSHITFLSTIMDGHPSVEIYLHPKAILRNTFPTRLYFALSTSYGEMSTDTSTLQLEAGESAQLFTGSNTASLRVQAEPLEDTSAVVGAVEVRTSGFDSSENISEEQVEPREESSPHSLGALMIHDNSGVVEGILNESTWAATSSGTYLPPTRLLSLDPRHILVDYSNSFSVECSDHPGSLELPSFLLHGALTTPLPQTNKDPRIILREGTTGRSVLLQARSVPYGKSSIEASPLPLTGNSGQFSGYYALKEDYNAATGALLYHIINGYKVVNDTPNDLIVAEASSGDHQFTLNPSASANVSWSSAKEDGLSLSVHHKGTACSIKIAVNAVGGKKYELRGDKFFGRLSVRVMPGGKGARLRIRIHSLIVDDAEGVAPMPANGIENKASTNDGKIACIDWGSGITINRIRIPHLRILQYRDTSQQLVLFAVDNLDAEFCIDGSASQMPGCDDRMGLSCAMLAVKGLGIDDLRSGHPVPVMACNSTAESNEDLFRISVDIQRPIQSDILELEVTTSFPTLCKQSPLDAAISVDFVDDISDEWRRCAIPFRKKTNLNERSDNHLRWKKFTVEPLYLSLAVRPGEDKRTGVAVSPLVYYIPSAVLDMLANGQDIAARVRLAEVALGDTSTDVDTLLRILQVFFASELKSCISAEFSEATQSDLLADLRQRREICQLYNPRPETTKAKKKVVFSEDSNTFDHKLKLLGCKAVTGNGAGKSSSEGIYSSKLKKTKHKSSKFQLERKKSEAETGTEKATGWFRR